MSYAHKLQYAGNDPYEPEQQQLPVRVMEVLEQDEIYQRLAEVRWLADELDIDLSGVDGVPAATKQALFEAVATGDEAPLQRMVDTYVERWLRVHRTDFEPDVVEPALANYTETAEVDVDA